MIFTLRTSPFHSLSPIMQAPFLPPIAFDRIVRLTTRAATTLRCSINNSAVRIYLSTKHIKQHVTASQFRQRSFGVVLAALQDRPSPAWLGGIKSGCLKKAPTSASNDLQNGQASIPITQRRAAKAPTTHTLTHLRIGTFAVTVHAMNLNFNDFTISRPVRLTSPMDG